MFDVDLVHKLALSFIPGTGPMVIRKLVSYCGGVEGVFTSSCDTFNRVRGIGKSLAKKITIGRVEAIERAKLELEYLANNDVEFLSCFDALYPERLKQCDDAPIVLYYKGNPDFNATKILAVVGTRKPTHDAIDVCNSILYDLSLRHKNLVIVSGLAYGIDAIAHKEALNNNLPTWAVLGHGFDTIYPKQNTKLAQKIIEENGAVLTEFSYKSVIDPSNFVKRNRIVAGICDALLVVDSGRKGGSMITADLANQYSRDVFAIPGSIQRSGGNGCNLLIKSHRANLVESYLDIEYITGWQPEIENIKTEQSKLLLETELNGNEKIVVEVLKQEQYVDMDTIVKRSELDAGTVSLVLLELEFKRIVRSLPGKIFSVHKK
jgi:DNA processing protein